VNVDHIGHAGRLQRDKCNTPLICLFLKNKSGFLPLANEEERPLLHR
jgi:hypothetical protein